MVNAWKLNESGSPSKKSVAFSTIKTQPGYGRQLQPAHVSSPSK